jgi:OOP family OmpA-OmpF porin
MRRLWMMMLAASLAGPVTAQEPAAPNQPSRIFFDWSKPDVRADYDAVLSAVAEATKTAPGVTVRLDGHSDRSGPAGANMSASRRRAETVQARLIALGVAASAIRIVTFGEQRSLIPTEDGVREVQNRRVDIWLLPSP